MQTYYFFLMVYVGQPGSPRNLSLMTRIQVGCPRILDHISGTLKAPFSFQIFPTSSSPHPVFCLQDTGVLSLKVERRAVEAITYLHLVATLRTRRTPCVFSLRKHNSGKNSLLHNKKCNYKISLFLRGVHVSMLNPLNPELNPICYLLALLGAHHFLHVSRIRVKLLTFRLLMIYIYIYIYI